MGFALAACFASLALADNESQLISKTCEQRTSSQDPTVQCLALVQSGKLSRFNVPWAYWYLSQNFSRRSLSQSSSTGDADLERSISYLRKAIETELENFAANPAYRDKRHPGFGPLNLRRVSAWYEHLGLLLSVVRAGEGETDRGFNLVKQERDSYSRALLYDRGNHKAHLGLAQALSRLCRSSEASASLRAAIGIVRQTDPESAYKYEREILPSCYRAWKDRSE